MFFGIILVTRYSSLGSLAASALAGILMARTATVQLDPWLYVYAVGGTVLVWLFHWDNIERLLRGQERKIGTPTTRGVTAVAPGRRVAPDRRALAGWP